jgi:predicted acylesterase/phospholipase RssA
MTGDIARLARCRYLVFGAGAFKGVAMVAALRALDGVDRAAPGSDGRGLFARLQGAAGTSIGSAIALAAVCRMPMERLAKVARDPETWSLDGVMADADIMRLLERRGLCSHDVLYHTIYKFMDTMGLDHDIDLATLHAQTGRAFVCNATDADDLTPVYLSHSTAPRMRVADALCASMCVPGFVEPFIWGGRSLVDGALVADYIPHVFPEDSTMGIAIAPLLSADACRRGSSSRRAPTDAGGNREANVVLDHRAPRGSRPTLGSAATKRDTDSDRHERDCDSRDRIGNGNDGDDGHRGHHSDDDDDDDVERERSRPFDPRTNGLAWSLGLVSGLSNLANAARVLTPRARASTLFIPLPPSLMRLRFRVSRDDIALLWDCGKRAAADYFSREAYAACVLACAIGETLARGRPPVS